jgi:hypothetical protein
MYPMKFHFYKDLGIAGGRFTLVGGGAASWEGHLSANRVSVDSLPISCSRSWSAAPARRTIPTVPLIESCERAPT